MNRHPRALAAMTAAVAGVAHLAIVWAARHPLDPNLQPFDLALPVFLGAFGAATGSTRGVVVVFALVWCPELASILDLPRAWGALGVLVAFTAVRPWLAPLVVTVLTLPMFARPADLGDGRSPSAGVEHHSPSDRPVAQEAAMQSGANGESSPSADGFSVASGPDILLITVDTVRADAGLLGGLTPTRSYPEAIAPAPWTLPSMLALFTGAPARESGQGMPTAGGWSGRSRPSLIRRLREAGYDTRAWVCNPHITAEFADGFRHFWHADDAHAALPTHVYDDLRQRFNGALPSVRHTRDERLEAAVLAAMAEPAIAPRFFWVHLLAPHEYTRDPLGPSAAGTRAAYAENVAVTRDRIARLVQPGWIVAVTSDHGEAFGEGGVTGHGHLLQDAELRVPLAFFGVDPGAIDGQVGIVAVLPTLARAAGLLVAGELADPRVAVGPPRRTSELAIRANGAYEVDSSPVAPGAPVNLDTEALEALGYAE